MKGITASFSPGALAHCEYLVTSKVLAGWLPVHIPADHKGVYTNLSVKNVMPKTVCQAMVSQATWGGGGWGEEGGTI